ncbi:MAG: 2-polyprenyl-6-methoxyphenol hydroxylase [Rhodospirillaceae bacterium]|jgi:2-polyprenyl-6-methoxyphenol hydroxylase-like FAD-dependent oxidoreductase|nr:2-polyprenyl-6-methoxyphenol hydroxylase [Rhodospirillaceae bacterium]MBT5048571.1 2-polyprenyl-6-methoxyphenol hydroxylase [Rhodospirillaceae bacterium]
MTDIPVLIVGGGPVGLAMAIELGFQGTECLLVEQGDGTTDFPRANTIDVRSMEFCRRWGIADDVRAVGIPPDFPHTALYLTSLAGYELARFDRASHGGTGSLDVSPERPQRCNQLFFDPVLRAHAGTLDGVTLRHRCRFDSFTRDDQGVTAIVRDLATDTEETIRAQYLIACCGGRSPIRKGLGIELGDEGAFGYPISIFFRMPELWAHHDKGKSALNFMLDAGGVWATLIPLDGRELWRITLHGSETYTDPATIDTDDVVRRVVGTDFDYELLNVAGWTRREMVADRYKYGRVFLAGDCAHQNTPTGGYGMNTGLGDVVDLGWKIAAMLRGWGGDGLLDSYQTDRRPVAARNVAEATANFKRRSYATADALCDPTPEGEKIRQGLGDQIVADNTSQHRGHGIALGHVLEDSPICVGDETAPPADTVKDYVPSTRPGARAPHAALPDGGSILDLFGHGFALLRLGENPPDVSDLVGAAHQRGVPLTVTSLDDTKIVALYERKLVLVRPDGYVAWRGDHVPGDPRTLIDHVRGSLAP